jgi:hypothetical protein
MNPDPTRSGHQALADAYGAQRARDEWAAMQREARARGVGVFDSTFRTNPC